MGGKKVDVNTSKKTAGHAIAKSTKSTAPSVKTKAAAATNEKAASLPSKKRKLRSEDVLDTAAAPVVDTAAKAKKIKAKAQSPPPPTTAVSSAEKIASNEAFIAPELIRKAVKALYKHRQEQETKAKETDKSKKTAGDSVDEKTKEAGNADHIFLTWSMKKIPESTKPAPIPVPLPHSLLEEHDEVCLITKDPQRTYKDLVAAHKEDLKRVTKVVGVSKLKAKFKPYEAKRQLANAFQKFVADTRVLPLLPKILGTFFIRRNKLPIAVDIVSEKNFVRNMQHAMASSSFSLTSGATSSLKVGHIALLTVENTLANVVAAMPTILKKVPGGLDNIQNVYIKTGCSMALPLYASLPTAAAATASTTKASKEDAGSSMLAATNEVSAELEDGGSDAERLHKIIAGVSGNKKKTKKMMKTKKQ